MTLSRHFAAQLACPRGVAGRVLGRAMDFANARPLQLVCKALDPQDGERILDVGCGTGTALAAVGAIANCKLYGLDRSETMIATARRRLGSRPFLVPGAAEDLPGPWPSSFDAVLAINLLYFAAQDGALVAGLRRALRIGGRLVVYVTDRQTMERWRFTRAGLHRLYDAHELEAALIEGGFASASISIKDYAIAPGIRGLIAHAER